MYCEYFAPGWARLWCRAVVLSISMIAVAACSSVLDLSSSCPDDVALSVTPGTEPTFQWSPSCEVVELQVYQGGHVVWTVHAFGGRSFAPPVRYGIAPEGATEQGGPEPLQSGVTYRVFIHEPGPGQSLRTVATTEFTP